MKAINERDIRAIKIGVAGLAAIGLYFLAGPWLNNWQMLRADLAAARSGWTGWRWTGRGRCRPSSSD